METPEPTQTAQDPTHVMETRDTRQLKIHTLQNPPDAKRALETAQKAIKSDKNGVIPLKFKNNSSNRLNSINRLNFG